MQQHYRHTYDFLNDDSFVAWVLFGEDKLAWRQFLVENPDKRLVAEQARRLLLDLHTAEGHDLPAMNKKAVWNKIQTNLQLPAQGRSPVIRTRLISPGWALAASVVLLLGMGWLLWQSQAYGKLTYHELTARIIEKNSVIEKVTSKQDSLRIILEDGSIITLGNNSKLSYPEHFEVNRRNVVLTGEAFFEVAKDPNRPFYIYSNEVVTKVLGTSFRIKAFDSDKQVLVQVKTGRVSVYSQKRPTLIDPETYGLVLLPNQQAIYSRPLQNLSRRLIELPLPLVDQPERVPVRYEQVPASRILRNLESQYGITILFNDDVLDRCVITTTLGDESLYEKLDLVCRTIGATYKEVDAQLIVESKGCR